MPVKGYRKRLCLRGHRLTGERRGKCLECRRQQAATRRGAVHPGRRKKREPRNLPIQIGATPAQLAEARAELAAWDAARTARGPAAKSAAVRAKMGLAH